MASPAPVPPLPVGTARLSLPRIVGVRSSDTLKGDDGIGVKIREASIVRGVGVLPMFAGLRGLLLLVGSLALTWARVGRWISRVDAIVGWAKAPGTAGEESRHSGVVPTSGADGGHDARRA